MQAILNKLFGWDFVRNKQGKIFVLCPDYGFMNNQVTVWRFFKLSVINASQLSFLTCSRDKYFPQTNEVI